MPDLPADIDPESRNRMPLVRRDDLDDSGKEMYDTYATHAQSLVGLQGPIGLRLHNPQLARVSQPLNLYLRFEAGLDEQLREVAILAVARELDSHFEWCAHEGEALKAGITPLVIDVIRRKEPVDGLSEECAALVLLVRESIGGHHVTSETYARALAALGMEPLLNYVALIANYAGTAILLNAFDQQLPAGKISSL